MTGQATLIPKAYVDKKAGRMRVYLDMNNVPNLIHALDAFCRKNKNWDSEAECVAEMTDLRDAIIEAIGGQP